jgi:hypothetical protein
LRKIGETVSLKVKAIRKLMGWCPYAKANEAKWHISLENFDLNIPDREKGDGGDLKNLRWFRKESNRILLIAFFTMFLYSLVLRQIGINLVFLFVGLLIALIYFAFYWKTQMQRYDDMVKHSVIDYSNDKISTLVKILFLFYFLMTLLGIFIGRELAWQAMLSFYGGLLVFFWLSYFQIKYWEKINNKTIFFDKKYGRWKKSYIIKEKK